MKYQNHVLFTNLILLTGMPNTMVLNVTNYMLIENVGGLFSES